MINTITSSSVVFKVLIITYYILQIFFLNAVLVFPFDCVNPIVERVVTFRFSKVRQFFEFSMAE